MTPFNDAYKRALEMCLHLYVRCKKITVKEEITLALNYYSLPQDSKSVAMVTNARVTAVPYTQGVIIYVSCSHI